MASDGSKIPVTRFDADGTTVQKPGEALSKSLDPDHSKNGVQVQLGNGYGSSPMGGFVKSFIDSRRPRGRRRPRPLGCPDGLLRQQGPAHLRLSRA